MYLLTIIKNVMLKNKLAVTSILLFTCIQSSLPFFEVIILQNLVESMEHFKGIQIIFLLLFLFLMIALIFPKFFRGMESIVNQYLSHLVDCEVSKLIYSKISVVKLPLLETGDKMNLISRAMRVNSSGIQSLVTAMLSFAMETLTMVMLLSKFGVLGLVIVLISIIFIIPYTKGQEHLSQKRFRFDQSMEERNRYINHLKHFLSDKKNSAELFAYHTKELYNDKLYEEQKKLFHQRFLFDKKAMCKEIVLLIGCEMAMIVSYLAVAVFLFLGKIEVSLAISAAYSVITIVGTLIRMVSIYTTIQNQKRVLYEFKEAMELEEEEETIEHDEEEEVSIQFKEVDYCYKGTDKRVLEQINLSILNKEKIAIVGHNGSGKSTLIRLLLGYDTPTNGALFFHQSTYDIQKVREITSIMLQSFCKYQLKLKDNIAISNISQMENESIINHVLEWTEIEEFVTKLPDGLETDVSSDGVFSGGEWQKIALSRAKFKDAKMYILDEPNAAVDALYEMKMYEKFLSLSEGKNAIIVSHRLPICQLCDRIIVMDQGKIIETGSHQELIEKETSYYRKMYYTQAQLYQ